MLFASISTGPLLGFVSAARRRGQAIKIIMETRKTILIYFLNKLIKRNLPFVYCENPIPCARHYGIGKL
jgi:hypothetical protein